MKILDVAGLLLLSVAGLLAWLPFGLAVTGSCCLWLSWSLQRGERR